MFLCAWLSAILLFVPPLAFILGAACAGISPLEPPVLLQACCLAAVVLVSAFLFVFKKKLARILEPCRPTPAQVFIALCFAFVITVPRLIASQAALPEAIHDDPWHYQKIVSVFATFPALKHFLFPEFDFGYYFYAYMLPAAAYTLKTGLNLKMLWAVYTGLTAGCLTLFVILCINGCLPRSAIAKTFFALLVTAGGGLHEWPVMIRAWMSGAGNWHTEWWAQGMGLDMQVSNFYSTYFWAPQHAHGLALFALVFAFLMRAGDTMRVWFVCGLLLGLEAGFSVYAALFSSLFAGCLLLVGMWARPKEQLARAACLAAGLGLGILPVAGFYLDMKGSLGFTVPLKQLPVYGLFYVAEFGVLLVLFVLYCKRVFAARDDGSRQGRCIVLFIALSFIAIVCLKSSGFNIISYRGMLPAQLLLAFTGALVIARPAHQARGFLWWAATALLCLQLTAFVPELLAMTKRCLDCRRSPFRLQENVVRINAEEPLAAVVDIPYRPGVSTMQLNVLLNNIFRPKNVAKEYFCEGTLYGNNLVYLGQTDQEALKRACNGSERR